MSSDEKHKEYPPIRRQETHVMRPEEKPREFDVEVMRAFHTLLSQGKTSPESGNGGFSLRDILYVLFRHKKKILVIFMLVSAVTVYYLASSISMYKAEAKVFIRGDRSNVAVDPTAESNSFLRSDKGADVQVRSEMALIASAAVAERAVDIIGEDKLLASAKKPQKKNAHPTAIGQATHAIGNLLQKPVKGFFSLFHLIQAPMTPREKLVQGIINHLEVAPSSGGSAVINVDFSASDPAMAQKILNAVLEGYLQAHISVHKSPVSADFFKERAAQIQAKLHAKEEAYDKRRKDLNIASMSTERELLLNQLNLLDTRISETGAEMSSSQARISALHKTLSGAKTSSEQGSVMSMSVDPETARLNDQLVQLRMKEMDLRTKYKDGYKDLEDTRSQIKQLSTMIKNQKSDPVMRGTDPLRQGLTLQHETERAVLDGLVAREARLSTEANDVRNRLRELVSHEKELDSLQREVALVENEYQQYMKTLQASQISDLLDRGQVGNVSILQHATKPSNTVRTQKKTLALLAFGIFAGIAGGIGLAFVLEFLNHSIKTSEDIEMNLGLPVLVSLPDSKHHRPSMEEEVA